MNSLENIKNVKVSDLIEQYGAETDNFEWESMYVEHYRALNRGDIQLTDEQANNSGMKWILEHPEQPTEIKDLVVCSHSDSPSKDELFQDLLKDLLDFKEKTGISSEKLYELVTNHLIQKAKQEKL